jgi:hypothetical protein
MPMFEPRDALKAFREHLAARGLSETTLSVRNGFEAMLDFYRDIRAKACDFEDADMLLFQWGTYDWQRLPLGSGTDRVFEANLTRQLILHERSEDDDIWQLELTFEFAPTDQLGALGTANRWCHSLQELPQFREHVLASQVLAVCSPLQVQRVTLDHECVG